MTKTRCFPAGSGEDAYQYLLDYVRYTPCRSGTSMDAAARAWIARELQSLGYEVQEEKFRFDRFNPRQYALRLDGFSPEVFPIYYSGHTDIDGIRASLVELESESDCTKARGCIGFSKLPIAANFYLPGLDALRHNARAAGVSALVVAIQGPENLIVAQNVDSRRGVGDIPILLVGKRDGLQIRECVGQRATLVLGAELDTASHYGNVIGSLPGSGDDFLVIGTPVNGWFTAAAERGAGIGTLLTLARYFAASGPHEKTLMFVATGAHEIGMLGLQAFLDKRPSLASHIDCYLHLGAGVAAHGYLEVNGKAKEMGLANIRGLYASETRGLSNQAAEAMLGQGVVPLVCVPPALFNPGEQSTMYRAGVPIIAISAPHHYLHTSGDLPDGTSPQLLAPIVTAFRGLIRKLLLGDGGE